MFIKILIVVLLVAVVLSLALGLVFLVRDKGRTQRTAKALTLRISLSVALFALLMAAYAAGLIEPHGIYPVSP
jgi:hypothetical protein